ncbi:MAG: vitamin B12 dependent-methionine synthase activation domain-containing protein [Synergistaceae bacterium]
MEKNNDFVLKETLRLLHITSNQDKELLSKIEEAEKKLKQIIKPQTLSKRVEISLSDDVISLSGHKFASKDLSKLLSHCKTCIIMVTTLGYDTDKYITKLQLNDMAEAVITDAIASAMADSLCDCEEARIARTLNKNEYMTMRFSPGYGDVPLAVSEIIIDFLQANKRAGISLTKSMMLLPVKSVTAIIGISDRKEKRQKSCDICSISENCIYKKRGEICGVH